MTKRSSIITFSIILLFAACTKPYDFDAGEYEELLVVEGLITDDPEEVEVKISYNYSLDTTASIQVTDATVWIEDENGNRTDFTITENGVRYLPPDGFSGTAGSTYQLFIEHDGVLYNSTPEKLIPAPELDSIYHRYAELPNDDNEANEGGIQFFIDSHDFSGETQFYRYEWVETYKIDLLYPERWLVDPEDTSFIFIEDPLEECFTTNRSNELLLGSSIGVTENRIAEFPVRFIGEEFSRPLEYRYSLLVKQFAISEGAYIFYKKLDDNNNYGGSLFDKQAGAVYGNISAVDEDKQILGYFEASGVKSMRSFFNNREFDKRMDIENSTRDCPDYVIFLSDAEEVLTVEDSLKEHIYIYMIDNELDPPIQAQISRFCSDCSYYANTNRPDFWID